MGAIIVYILKSGVALILFYIFYRLLLPTHTFYRFNRIVIMGVILLSAILPLYTPVLEIEKEIAPIETLPLFIETEISEFISPVFQVSVEDEMLVMPRQESSGSFVWFLIAILYLVGCLGCFLYTLFSFYRLYKLTKSSEIIKTKEGFYLFLTPQSIAPFSWMNYIVISHEDWQEYGQNIFLHEQGHIQSGHSWDLLLLQICVILHWFNPVAWLLKQELQNIHEYEADKYVLDKGVNAKQYQLLLIKKAVGTQRFTSMANSFNHSKLKKRITMMLKDKSNPWACIKYLYIFPVSLFVVTVFARPEITEPLEKISAVKISEIFPEEKIPEVTVSSSTTEIETKESLSSVDEIFATDSIDNNDSHIIAEQMIRTEERMAEILHENSELVEEVKEEETTQSVIRHPKHPSEVKWVPATSALTVQGYKAANQEYWVRNTPFLAGHGDKLILVDGEESEIDSVEGDDIHSFAMLPGEKATTFFGSKGKNGAILVTTKKAKDKDFYSYIYAAENDKEVVGEKRDVLGSNNELVLIDDEEGDINSINIDDIHAVNIFKGEAALSVFGERGRNGVVMIITKKANEEKESANRVEDQDLSKNELLSGSNLKSLQVDIQDPYSSKSENSSQTSADNEFRITSEAGLLFIVDGEEFTYNVLDELDKENIESVGVLKGRTGYDIYGEKGKNGVVIIKTKNAGNKKIVEDNESNEEI